MLFHCHMCLKRLTENFRLQLFEKCTQDQEHIGDSLVLAVEALSCVSSHPGNDEIKHSALFRMQQCMSCFGSSNQQCYFSCITAKQNGKFSLMALLCWREILALHPCNNSAEFAGWFSSHLVLGYGMENIF